MPFRLSVLLPVLALSVAGCGDGLPPMPKVEGRACAASDAATFARQTRRLKSFGFNDITVRRRSGHGSCTAYSGGSLCHWSSPALLQVTSRGKDWWFAPGVGERVILTVVDGTPRCVIDQVQTTEEWARKHMSTICRSSRMRPCP